MWRIKEREKLKRQKKKGMMAMGVITWGIRSGAQQHICEPAAADVFRTMSRRAQMTRSMSQDNDLVVRKRDRGDMDDAEVTDGGTVKRRTRDTESKKAKQSPSGKALVASGASGKRFFSYAQIHETIIKLRDRVKNFNPDVMIAIGGGGFIPARILRTVVKIPILAVSLELYDDATSTAKSQVKKVQWFDETSGVGKLVRGKRVLVVDEVDDTRTTLAYCVAELRKTNSPAAIAVCVVHNKLKPKRATLPDDVEYMAGADVPNRWNCYPWDAEAYGHSIVEHEKLSRCE